MTFWRDNQTAVAACILALLCEDGTRIYLPSRAMQERLNLESEPFDQALQQLLSSGALEGCVAAARLSGAMAPGPRGIGSTPAVKRILHFCKVKWHYRFSASVLHGIRSPAP